MARAEAVEADASLELVEAGDAMLLMISGAMWHTLVLQSKSEGVSPGDVLDKALRAYLEEHGSHETIEYLWDLKRSRVR